MSWPHLRLGCEIVRGRGVHAASTPPDNITLKRAEARAPSAATVLIKPPSEARGSSTGRGWRAASFRSSTPPRSATRQVQASATDRAPSGANDNLVGGAHKSGWPRTVFSKSQRDCINQPSVGRRSRLTLGGRPKRNQPQRGWIKWRIEETQPFQGSRNLGMGNPR